MSEIWATSQSKVLDLFASHFLSLVADIKQKFMTLFKQAVM